MGKVYVCAPDQIINLEFEYCSAMMKKSWLHFNVHCGYASEVVTNNSLEFFFFFDK
jgi:hypothetical protein